MTDKPIRTRGLGRGLSALMADIAPETAVQDAPRRADQNVPVERIHPNPDQPRRTFDEVALTELAASISEKGIIQPLIVRAAPGQPGHFQIVAGERRWRAAQRAQLHDVPVVVRDYDDTEVLEVAIIENIQRSDLNSIDEAAGYRQLMDRFGHTQEILATALGKSRSHIANSMRLLTLPDAVQTYVVNGDLTAGHARALIGQDNAEALARQIIQQKLSVRDTEKLVRKASGTTQARRKSAPGKSAKDADTLQIEAELAATLRMPVNIDHSADGEGGKLTLHYGSLDQLDDLLRALAGS